MVFDFFFEVGKVVGGLFKVYKVKRGWNLVKVIYCIKKIKYGVGMVDFGYDVIV